VRWRWWMCILALVVGEVLIMWGYVLRRPYTEIDFSTYMEQVALVEAGERRYDLIRGAQGPLVYPAGFVWLYRGLSWVTEGGAKIRRAQNIFAGLFVVDSFVASLVYKYAYQEDPEKWKSLLVALIASSRRAHSVYALRLFNDGPCATLCHCAIFFLVSDFQYVACVLFSLAVSVKMSALLFAPAWYVVMASKKGHGSALRGVLLCAFVQIFVALPFLFADPQAYVRNAFDVSRGFKHKWSVNFKWVPCAQSLKETDLRDCDGPFSSSFFKLLLLGLHALALVLLAHFRWRLHCKGRFLGLFDFFQLRFDPRIQYTKKAVIVMLCSCNFVGIAFARSLHFQFCVWYLKTLPLLVFSTRLPLLLKIALLVAIEAAWNPWQGQSSTIASSLLLTASHAILFFALLRKPDVPDFSLIPQKPRTTGKKKIT